MKLFICLAVFCAFVAIGARNVGAVLQELNQTNTKEVSAQVKRKKPEPAVLIDQWASGVCDQVFPAAMVRDFPYYQAGYDFSGRPVIVWQAGRWRFKKWTEGSYSNRKLVHRLIEQFWCRLYHLPSEINDVNDGVMIIVDAADFDASELNSWEAIKAQLLWARIGEKYESLVTDFWMVNPNSAASAWINLVRPVGSRLFNRLKTKRATKDRYLPVLRSLMDDTVVPPSLGGTSKEWKPVASWG